MSLREITVLLSSGWKLGVVADAWVETLCHKKKAIYRKWHSHKMGVCYPNNYENAIGHVGHLLSV